MTNDSDIVFDVLRSLWDLVPQDPRHRLLPLDRASLEEFLPRLREFVAAAPFETKGTVDSVGGLLSEEVAIRAVLERRIGPAPLAPRSGTERPRARRRTPGCRDYRVTMRVPLPADSPRNTPVSWSWVNRLPSASESSRSPKFPPAEESSRCPKFPPANESSGLPMFPAEAGRALGCAVVAAP